MKRAFLFGLGSFFVVGVIAGLQEMFVGHEMAGAAIAVVCVPLSIVTVRAAKSAPPHFSRLHAVIGWLAGFLCIDVLIGSLVGIALVVT